MLRFRPNSKRLRKLADSVTDLYVFKHNSAIGEAILSDDDNEFLINLKRRYKMISPEQADPRATYCYAHVHGNEGVRCSMYGDCPICTQWDAYKQQQMEKHLWMFFLLKVLLYAFVVGVPLQVFAPQRGVVVTYFLAGTISFLYVALHEAHERETTALKTQFAELNKKIDFIAKNTCKIVGQSDCVAENACRAVQSVEPQPESHYAVGPPPENHEANRLEEALKKKASELPPRYMAQDAYTLAELERLYRRTDTRGKIRLFKSLYRQGIFPSYTIALDAATSGDASLREWMARYSTCLDYSGKKLPNGDSGCDLEDVLRNDEDVFVRAALCENPETLGLLSIGREFEQKLLACTHLERLGLVRNERLKLIDVMSVFDSEDQTLQIPLSERTELAVACATNWSVVQDSRRIKGMDFSDGCSWYETCKASRTIWQTAAKWPNDSRAPYFVFAFIDAEDKTKAEIFLTCNRDTRLAIMESCTPDDRKTLHLGRNDEDDTIRFIAYARSKQLEKGEMEDILAREKVEVALSALLENPWLGSLAQETRERLSQKQSVS
jgi:hypothetical protein